MRAPAALWPWQEDVVEWLVDAPPGARAALIAPTGAGKATVAVETVRRLSEREPELSVLVIYQFAAVGRNLLARARAASGLDVWSLDKRRLRTLAVAGEPFDWPRSTIVGVAARDLHEVWVRRVLAQNPWALTIVDGVHDIAAISPWLDELSSARLLALSDSPTIFDRTWRVFSGPHMHVAPGQPQPGASETVEFSLSTGEASLAGEVHSAAALGAGHPEWHASALRRASDSSPFAVQAAALRLLEQLRPLRNSYTHGTTETESSLSSERRQSLSQIIPYFAALESIVRSVDALEEDSRFEAFLRIADDQMARDAGSLVVFTADRRTAEYIADRLRFLQYRVELVSPGWDPVEPSGPNTIYVVPDDSLRGLDLGLIAIGIHYDEPRGRRALREARISSTGQRRIFALQAKS